MRPIKSKWDFCDTAHMQGEKSRVIGHESGESVKMVKQLNLLSSSFSLLNDMSICDDFSIDTSKSTDSPDSCTISVDKTSQTIRLFEQVFGPCKVTWNAEIPEVIGAHAAMLASYPIEETKATVSISPAQPVKGKLNGPHGHLDETQGSLGIS